jgi:hypothetical protein
MAPGGLTGALTDIRKGNRLYHYYVSQNFPLVPYLDTLRWMFIAIALAGIAVAVYARLDDWKRGWR